MELMVRRNHNAKDRDTRGLLSWVDITAHHGGLPCRPVYMQSCKEKINYGQEMFVLFKGECVAEEGRFVCRCQPGWTGAECGVRSHNVCQPDTCLNDATCVDDETGFTCICTRQFAGRKRTNLGLNGVGCKAKR